MKISKLFHWLYGAVMLLPLFAIGVTCGYAMFNKNAYKSYYGETYDEQYFNGLDASDLEKGKVYYVYDETNDYSLSTFSGSINLKVTEYKRDNVLDDTVNNIDIYWNNNNLYFNARNGTSVVQWNVINSNNALYSFKFDLYTNSSQANVTLLKIFGYYGINPQNKLSEIFNYSLDRLTKNSYFNWAYDSFLVAPFSYIVSLFSIPSNSPVVMLMSYWLAISIIWLVFDLVMYVPLLVHRWLDKGAIE